MASEKAYDVKDLAARVIDHILQDESLADQLVEVFKGKRPPTCPEKELCCEKAHVCKDTGTGDFVCPEYFSCMNGHVVKVIGRF